MWAAEPRNACTPLLGQQRQSVGCRGHLSHLSSSQTRLVWFPEHPGGWGYEGIAQAWRDCGAARPQATPPGSLGLRAYLLQVLGDSPPA